MSTTDSRSADPSPSRPSRALWVLGTLGAVILGLVLLVAGWAKAIHPEAFFEQIRGQGLDFLLPAEVVAFIALALEFGLGTLLVLGVRRRWVLIPATLLVALFVFLTGRDYLRHLQGVEPVSTSCGCFGNLVERSPAEAFWQDLLLLVPPLALAFLGRRREAPFPIVRTAVAGAVTVAALVLAWFAPTLPLDDLATRLAEGDAVETICAGSDDSRVCLSDAAPQLMEGEHLAVILDPEDEGFDAALEAAAAYQDERSFGAAADAPPLVLLADVKPEKRQELMFLWGLELQPAPETLLAPLVRRYPRSFRVEAGEVIETWSGLAPFERWTDPASLEEPAAGG